MYVHASEKNSVTKIYANGNIMKRVISAKSGPNGFVEYFPYVRFNSNLMKYRNSMVTQKIRANVKISFNCKLESE